MHMNAHVGLYTRFSCNTVGQVRMMGLALDSSRQKLYYTDEGSDAKIAEISTDGRRHRVVLRQPGMKPRAVVLHNQRRLVYYRST